MCPGSSALNQKVGKVPSSSFVNSSLKSLLVFLYSSSTCRYKFYNLSTGELSWSYPTLSEPPSGTGTSLSFPPNQLV